MLIKEQTCNCCGNCVLHDIFQRHLLLAKISLFFLYEVKNVFQVLQSSFINQQAK